MAERYDPMGTVYNGQVVNPLKLARLSVIKLPLQTLFVLQLAHLPEKYTFFSTKSKIN